MGALWWLPTRIARASWGDGEAFACLRAQEQPCVGWDPRLAGDWPTFLTAGRPARVCPDPHQKRAAPEFSSWNAISQRPGCKLSNCTAAACPTCFLRAARTTKKSPTTLGYAVSRTPNAADLDVDDLFELATTEGTCCRGADSLECVEVVLVLNLPPQDVVWGSSPHGTVWLADRLRLSKGGFCYWWRSHLDLVWNHQRPRAGTVLVPDGPDEDVLRAPRRAPLR